MVDDEIKIIRQVRHEISAEFDHDIDRVLDYYRSVEVELKRSGRYRFAAQGTGLAPACKEKEEVAGATIHGHGGLL